jgi:very-short-patch-repair endonuclease
VCKICNSNKKGFRGLSIHLRNYHNISLLDYYIKYEDFKIEKCIYCNKERKLKSGLVFHKTCCYEECKKKFYDNKNKMSSHSKNLISGKIKKAHKEGRHPGWNHINLNKNNRSKPEEIFLNWINNDDFFIKYTIEEKKPFFKYSLDFAILELKTDIEIDGIQHIRSKESIDHDKKRDEFMINKGWRVYRISVKDFYRDKENTLFELKKWLKTLEKYRIYDIESLKRTFKKPVYGTMDDYIKKIKNDKHIRNENNIKLVIDSKIDFLKFGWVNKVSNLIGIRHQRVNKWMKDFLPHILEFAYKKR